MKLKPSFVALGLYPITPSDSALLASPGVIKCKGAAGNVVITGYDGVVQTYPIALEETLPVIALKVDATSTTATGLWCLKV